jgi:hypothetical protein
VTAIAHPVAGCKSNRGRQIVNDAVVIAIGVHRPLKICHGQGDEKRDREPVPGGGHAKGERRRKMSRARAPLMALTAVLVTMTAACKADTPSAQALANVDGAEISRREVVQGLSSTSSGGGKAAIAAELERMVERRILAQEAEDLGLEKDARFHFDSRRAREVLLVQALERELEREVKRPSAEEIERYLAARPWRFGERYRLAVERNGERAVVDSFSFGEEPEAIGALAQPGSRIRIEGLDWTVTAREEAPVADAEARELASRELLNMAVAEAMKALVDEKRRNGAVRYQVGWGPGTR